MDKLWMIAALLATLSFAAPLFMPATMKPRLGLENMFSLYGVVEVVQVIALMFLLAVFAAPFQKRESDRA
jgi:flagellar biosynthesis protein FlhB